MTYRLFAEQPPVENRFAGLKPAALSPTEKRALIDLALAVLKQRHRSGRALTSPDDTRAYRGLMLADVRVLDHFVVAAGESVSFAERGLL